MVAIDDMIYIQRVLDGETASFAHLVDKHKNMVYSVILKLVKVPEDAEELAQDTFVKAYNKLAEFNGESRFSTWLYTIAYRTALSRLRIKVINKVEDHSLYDTADSGLKPLEIMEFKERKEMVKSAINQLPEADAVAVTLFYLDDCSVAEVSEIMSLSPSNVKVKLHRARKALKQLLAHVLMDDSSVSKDQTI